METLAAHVQNMPRAVKSFRVRRFSESGARHRPDVPVKLLETVDDAHLRYGKADLRRIRTESRKERAASAMEVFDGKWRALRGLGRGVKALRLDATEAIALGDGVQQIAVQRPCRRQVHVGSSGHG